MGRSEEARDGSSVQTLKRELGIQRLVTATATELLTARAEVLDGCIDRAVGSFGQMLRADWACLLLHRADGASVVLTSPWTLDSGETSALGVRPAVPNLPEWWQRQLTAQSFTAVADVGGLPSDAAPTTVVGLPSRSVVAIAVRNGGETLGSLWCGASAPRPDWEAGEFDAAETFGDLIGGALSRRAIKTELRESRERLNRGQVFANIGTWERNLDNNDLIWSERLPALLGRPAGEQVTVYQDYLRSVHPDDQQFLCDRIVETIKVDATYHIEYRVVWPDGTVRWVEDQGKAVRDATGRARRMVGVLQDIDDRKRAELALEERDAQLRKVEELAQIGYWATDRVTGSMTWSDEVYEVFGVDRTSFIPTIDRVAEFLVEDDRHALDAAERSLEATGRYDARYRIIRPDGQVRHLRILGIPETNADGFEIGIRGAIQDVTDQVEKENRLKISEREMKRLAWERGKRIREMDCLSRILLVLADENADEAATLSTVVNLIPSGWRNAKATCARIRLGNAAFISDRFVETEDRISATIPTRSSEEQGVVEVHYDTSVDPTGSAAAFLREEADLLETIAAQIGQAMQRRRAQRALVAARDEAERANRAKSDFLSSMSHELRTPMNAILGFTQLLEDDASLSEANRECVFEVLRAGHHLLDLINSVLDLARVEAGQLELVMEQVDAGQVLTECIALAGPLAEPRKIGLSISLEGNGLLWTDPTRLRQAVLNLLSNAIKYNRENGSVAAALSREGEAHLRLSITDTGPGIPEDQIDGLFEPFARFGPAAASIEGTGIGLTITKRMIGAMGGWIDVASDLGTGSTFSIVLPLAEARGETTDGDLTIEPVSQEPAIVKAESRSVLYIEDNPANLKLVTRIFERPGYPTLLTAQDAETGLRLAKDRKPDLVLLDISLPGMDGYEVLDRLRAEPTLRATPVIAVTAHAMPGDADRGLDAGFYGYLTKPLDLEAFAATIDQWLHDSDATRDGAGRRSGVPAGAPIPSTESVT